MGPIGRIVVVGVGTAGYFTALALKRQLPHLDVTLVVGLAQPEPERPVRHEIPGHFAEHGVALGLLLQVLAQTDRRQARWRWQVRCGEVQLTVQVVAVVVHACNPVERTVVIRGDAEFLAEPFGVGNEGVGKEDQEIRIVVGLQIALLLADISGYTALAASLTSARVGRGSVRIDSSTCVATITGMPDHLAFLVISFCEVGTFSRGISRPISPLATMTP